MNALATKIKRPRRWDEPFDAAMSDQDVAELLKLEPFASMDPTSFPNAIPLAGILKNDCRLADYHPGDLIVREGDYGNSAFLVLFGEPVLSLKCLPEAILGRQPKRKKGWAAAISQLWNNSRGVEQRNFAAPQSETSLVCSDEIAVRQDDRGAHVFLHDVPRVVPVDQSLTLKVGEFFGEISALTRTPRSATIVASSPVRLLEIRWQGFRELLKRNDSLRTHIETLYRENSLRTHLREMDELRTLPESAIEALAEATLFETYGTFQWNADYQSTQAKDIAARILSEPIIAEQGAYVDGVLLIRNGFARLSRRHGDGHQTVAYLGKGKSFGFREVFHNWQTGEQRPWSLSLRAVGYVDILRIPTATMEAHVLPHLAEDTYPPLLPPTPSSDPSDLSPSQRANPGVDRRGGEREPTVEPGLLEFLVEKRLVNGTQTMMIDLDRCTRCDDCVRACASTHDNNPRFNRTGEIYDRWMITNACMHCLDPVCMIGCPTGAINRSGEDGHVAINDQTCIGCSTCANSCPYGNINMVEINDRRGLPIVAVESGEPIRKATKCDLCSDQPGGPACQNACPHDALVRIDLTTPDAITKWSKR